MSIMKASSNGSGVITVIPGAIMGYMELPDGTKVKIKE